MANEEEKKLEAAPEQPQADQTASETADKDSIQYTMEKDSEAHGTVKAEAN